MTHHDRLLEMLSNHLDTISDQEFEAELERVGIERGGHTDGCIIQKGNQVYVDRGRSDEGGTQGG